MTKELYSFKEEITFRKESTEILHITCPELTPSADGSFMNETFAIIPGQADWVRIKPYVECFINDLEKVGWTVTEQEERGFYVVFKANAVEEANDEEAENASEDRDIQVNSLDVERLLKAVEAGKDVFNMRGTLVMGDARHYTVAA